MKNINKIFDLKGKIAVITGGMGMLGTEYTKTLLEAGAKVAIYDIVDLPNKTFSQLEKSFPLKFFKVDVTNKKEVESVTQKVEKDWGIPHILINNAGLGTPPDSEELFSGPFEDYPLDSFYKIFNSHLIGAMICCQVIGTKMVKEGRGSIINISSHYGILPPEQNIYDYRLEDGKKPFIKPISYCIAKASMIYLTKYLAVLWGGKIRVNTLVPGGVYKDHDPRFVKAYSNRTILGKMASKEDYNGAILFLASEASSYMTGETLVLDGGWRIK